MWDLLIWISETVQTGDFWSGVLEVAAGVFSFTVLMALSEWRRTTKRLKKYVTAYKEGVEYEWQDKTEEFVVTYRVRAFELLLRNVLTLQPRTPAAYRRVEQIRDVLERWHRGIPIIGDEPLPLPKLGEFPAPPSAAIEAFLRNYLLERLRAIKWLGLKEPAEESGEN